MLGDIMVLADLGLIGNCQLSALARRDVALVWSWMDALLGCSRLRPRGEFGSHHLAFHDHEYRS